MAFAKHCRSQSPRLRVSIPLLIRSARALVAPEIYGVDDAPEILADHAGPLLTTRSKRQPNARRRRAGAE